MENNTFQMFDEVFPMESYGESYPMLPCSSSTGSLESASTPSPVKGPFTPPSGRSTPGFRPIVMDHDGDNVNGFNFDYVLHNEHLQQHINNIEHHPFANQIISPPAEFPQVPYQYDPVHYQMDPSWPWGAENQMTMFEKQPQSALGIPPVAMPPQLAIPRVEGHYVPQTYLTHHERRSGFNKVRLETTEALQRVQGGRINKRIRKSRITAVEPEKIAGYNVRTSRLAGMSVVLKASFLCEWPSCSKVGKAFKRHEHLKRHVNTLLDLVWCPMCWHCFNRHDNSRNHVLEHTKEEKDEDENKKRRVKYHPLAPALYAQLMEDVKNRRSKKKVPEPEPEPPRLEGHLLFGPWLPQMMTIKMLTEDQKIMHNVPRHVWNGDEEECPIPLEQGAGEVVV
ncbi:hypothetical protein GGR51DRAFT_562579 [Nemania sp. FL0031]|nr:hypothetical protein GGR51DRAFT_562579 [Nemania sp. FL0031]